MCSIISAVCCFLPSLCCTSHAMARSTKIACCHVITNESRAKHNRICTNSSFAPLSSGGNAKRCRECGAFAAQRYTRHRPAENLEVRRQIASFPEREQAKSQRQTLCLVSHLKHPLEASRRIAVCCRKVHRLQMFCELAGRAADRWMLAARQHRHVQLAASEDA